MKRVLLTVHKFFPQHRAGTEVLTLKIAQSLIERGYVVKVVTCEPPDLDARFKEEHKEQALSYEYEYEGVPVHVIGERLRLTDYDFSYEYYHPQIKRHFMGIIDDFKPDLIQMVHAQNLSASIVEAAKQKNVPVVFYSTDFWFVCPIVQLKRPNGDVCRGPGPHGLKCLDCYTPKLFPPGGEIVEAIEHKYQTLGTAINAMPGPLKSLTCGALSTAYCLSKTPGAVRATLDRPAVLRNFANQIDQIMVPTKLMRDIFVENGIAPGKITHVPFGIDTSKLVGYQNKIVADKLRVGFIGTFFEHKGVDLLLKAFHALPSKPASELKLYGDPQQFPEYFAKLKKIAEGGPRKQDVHFMGTFPNDKLGEVLQEIDILAVPSRWYENTPLVMQSALATRTPLVVTDLGGMSELVKDGENGLLFKLNDHGSLREKLLSVLKNRSLLTGFMNNIKPERTVPAMVDDIESVWARVLTVPAGK